MARGRQYTAFCTLEECIQVLMDEYDHEQFWAVATLAKPREDVYLSISEIQGLNLIAERLPIVCIRNHPISDAIPAAVIFDAMIPEGLVQVEVPVSRQSGMLSATVLLVGLEDPKRGVPSPLPLFNRLKRRFERICRFPMPSYVEPEPMRRYNISAGIIAHLRSGGTLDSS